MAFFRLCLKNGKKGTAAEHCDYINREGHYSSGRKAEELKAKGMMNLPPWAVSPKDFFRMADLYERTRGSAYKSLEIALPCELSLEKNVELAVKIVEEIAHDKVAAWAIHSKQSELSNAEQIHLHIMDSERMITDTPENFKGPDCFFKRYNRKNPELGGYKKDRRFAVWGNRYLRELRSKIAELINEAYSKEGIPIRVSAKTLAAQKEDAVRAGDMELAEFLNRKKAKYVPFARFKKYQQLLENSGLIDHAEMVPMMPVLGADNYLDLIERDLGLDVFLRERAEIQLRKYKLLKEKSDKDEQAFPILLKNFGACSLEKLKGPLAELSDKIEGMFEANRRYMKLVDLIYNSIEGSRLVMNFATRGLLKKIAKSRTMLSELEKKKTGLVLIKRYSPDIKIGSDIIRQKDVVSKLEEEYNCIKKQAETRARIECAVRNLNMKRQVRMKEYEIRKIENAFLQEITKELPKLVSIADTNSQIAFAKKTEDIILQMNTITEVESLYEDFQNLRLQFHLFANSECQSEQSNKITRRMKMKELDQGDQKDF